MTDGRQIALAIAPTVLPTLTVLVAILINNRLTDTLRIERRREFEPTRQLFGDQLRRVEDVMDARLKHLEEK